jgi:hypothetical protein
MRSDGSVNSVTPCPNTSVKISGSRAPALLGLGALATALALAFAGMTASTDASAQYRAASTQVRSSSSARYVSRTTRRVAVPVRNQRVYSAPRGATLLRSRYWDPRTRWMVDSRTHSTYSVLSNGEVWFMEPSSGWAYTVDRYGRVYGADPRNRSVYAFSSLNSWRGDLFYFFDYFSPYDGYYTVRDYDWFYSSYYGRRTPLYDYGYAYNTMWSDFDDFWFSNSFRRSLSFRYYEPAYIRYDAGWNSSYYYNSLPAVYIAPCYSYTVVNNTVVVNNNYYTNNNIVNNSGARGLPTAEQAAVQLSAQVAPPVVFASNEISPQQIADAGIAAPVETVKEVALEAMAPAPASEPTFEIPGLPAQDTQAVVQEPAAQEPVNEQREPVAENVPVSESVPAETQPGFSEPTREAPQEMTREEPAYQEPARQEELREEPAYQEPARQEEMREEPAYQEPARQEEMREEPAYQEPARQEEMREEPAYQEPAYEEPAYQEPARQEEMREEPAYQEPAYEEQSYEAPQQEQRYEEPSYQQQEQSYEEPSYQQQEQSYEAPQQEQRYEEPSYQQQEQSYEAPQQQERYEAPQQQEQSYEAPPQQRSESDENRGE